MIDIINSNEEYTFKRFGKDLGIVAGVACSAAFLITGGLRLLSRIG